MNNTQRNILLDALRGLAIYLVVVNHLANALWGKNILTELIAMVHLPVFFVVSGYLFYESYNKKELRELVKTRVFKLVKIYIIWSFVALSFNLLMNIENINSIFLQKELYEIFIQGRSVWFMLVLAMINAFYIFFISKFKKYTCRYIIISYCLLYIIQFILLPGSVFQLSKYKLYMLYFGVGILINIYKSKLVGIKERLNYTLLYMFCIIGTALYINSPLRNYLVDLKASIKELPQVILIICLSLLCILSVFSVVEKMKTSNVIRHISMWGGISLDIYLLHIFFVECSALIINYSLDYVFVPRAIIAIAIFVVGYVITDSIMLIKKYILGKLSIYKYLT